MYFDTSGSSRPSLGPTLRERFDSFPCHVAVAHEDLGLGRPGWGYEGVNSVPWALRASYQGVGRYLLTVRTVRSSKGLNPRGLPGEEPAIQIMNFLGRDEASRGTPRPPTKDETLTEHWATQRAVAEAATETVAVPCDGLPLVGERLTALGCSVVRLPWDDSTIWCAGQPEVIARLTLRTATPDDFTTTVPGHDTLVVEPSSLDRRPRSSELPRSAGGL